MPGACGVKSVPDDSVKLSSTEDSAGKVVFRTYCAACHHMIKDATGPALRGILKGRDTNFLNIFLTKRNRLKNDELVHERIEMYMTHCVEFPHLTKDDIRNLEAYIRGYSTPTTPSF